MAEILDYVDTDVVGGDGDGSSWANAFATPQLCETANAQALDGNWMHWVLSGSTAVGQLSINGSTMAAPTDYILVEAADENDHHDRASAAGWDAAKFHIEQTDNLALVLSDENIRIDGLQLQVIYSSAAGKHGISISGQEASNYIRITNCRILGDTDTSANGCGIVVNDADAIVDIWNCIVYKWDAGGIFVDNGATVNIWNSIICGINDDGVEFDIGTNTIKNCAVFDTVDDWQDDTGSADIDYCASDDNDDGTNGVDMSPGVEATNWAAAFENYSTGDFRLKAGSQLINVGVDNPGGGLYSSDMDGIAYDTPWDIGVSMYSEAAGSSIVPLVMNYYRRLHG